MMDKHFKALQFNSFIPGYIIFAYKPICVPYNHLVTYRYHNIIQNNYIVKVTWISRGKDS